MLPTRNRLSYKDSLRLTHFKRIFSPHFELKYVNKTQNDSPRFLLHIPKTKVKKSTHRNRMKRLISESIIHLPLPAISFDGVIRLVNPFRQEPTIEDVRSELKEMFTRIK